MSTQMQSPAGAGAAEAVRFRLDLAYDGGAFHGWARQPGLDSIQGALEEGLERILRRPVRTVVAGRTDAGVHARSAVGVSELPLDAPVEVELVVEVEV